MHYRNDLGAALSRIEELERRERELVAMVEAANERAKVDATANPNAKPNPPKSDSFAQLQHPWLKAGIAVALTFAAYYVVIQLYNHDKQTGTVCALVGAAIPFGVSARIWWPRKGDAPWIGFNLLRGVVLGLLRAPFLWKRSHFGEDFVFFWWGPILSVGVLVAELLTARCWTNRVGDFLLELARG
jgi:hypothetical protein